jgi:hypothetical protein
MDDVFSVPVEGIERRGVLPPDGGTIEFPALAQEFPHESGGPPECPESFRDLFVFRVVGVETNFPTLRK